MATPTTSGETLRTRGTFLVPSCKDMHTQLGVCADLVLTFGSTALTYTTGDYIGRRTVTVDVEAQKGMEYYPFDEYTVSGAVRVRNMAALAMNTDPLCTSFVCTDYMKISTAMSAPSALAMAIHKCCGSLQL